MYIMLSETSIQLQLNITRTKVQVKQISPSYPTSNPTVYAYWKKESYNIGNKKRKWENCVQGTTLRN